MPESVDDVAGLGLQKLLAPRSVAIVGASTRPGTFGNGLVRRVLEGGFPGRVHPVNPRYEEVEGLRCVPALAELPEPAKVAGQVHAATTKPFLVLSHASDALGARDAARLREAGVDVLVSCG
jgi:acetyltransferase